MAEETAPHLTTTSLQVTEGNEVHPDLPIVQTKYPVPSGTVGIQPSNLRHLQHAHLVPELGSISAALKVCKIKVCQQI